MKVGYKLTPKDGGGKKVKKITIAVKIYDTTGTLKITDMLLQGGSVATPWVGHPSEVRWSYDSV